MCGIPGRGREGRQWGAAQTPTLRGAGFLSPPSCRWEPMFGGTAPGSALGLQPEPAAAARGHSTAAAAELDACIHCPHRMGTRRNKAVHLAMLATGLQCTWVCIEPHITYTLVHTSFQVLQLGAKGFQMVLCQVTGCMHQAGGGSLRGTRCRPMQCNGVPGK